MAFVFHRYFHVLQKDGEDLIVTEEEWAKHRLTDADLDLFQQDMQNAYDSYLHKLHSGKMIIEPLTEDVVVNNTTISIKIGEKISFPGAQTLADTWENPAEFLKWGEQMKKDPNVIAYHPGGWVDQTP